jgi:anti-anti-sigma factor
MADSEINISRADAGEICVLKVAGKLDAKTAPRLGEELKALIASGRSRIVADLAAVTYIASAGVGTLKASLIDAKKNGGDLKLAALRAEVKDVFDVLGFTRLFAILPSAEAAVKGF